MKYNIVRAADRKVMKRNCPDIYDAVLELYHIADKWGAPSDGFDVRRTDGANMTDAEQEELISCVSSRY